MNNFGQLISHLAKKAGIPDDDQHLVGVLSNAELTRVNVPQDMFSAIDNRLLSIDDAKNNHPLVKAHYFAQAFNGLDSELERIKDELGLDDATWQELQGERSSTKRAAALVKKVKELTEKKAGAEPKAKDALQKQIDQLTTELVESKKDIQKEKDTAASTLRQMKIEGKLDAMVSTLPTIYDELDSEVRAMTVRNILQKAQAENDIEFVLDDAGQFDLLKKDGSKFYSENHQLIKPKDFIEKTLANSKVLKATQKAQSGSGAQGQQQGQQGQMMGQPPVNVQGGGQNGQPNLYLKQLLEQSQKDLETSGAVQMG